MGEGIIWCGRPGRQSTTGGKMGCKMDSLNEKKYIFYAADNFLKF